MTEDANSVRSSGSTSGESDETPPSIPQVVEIEGQQLSEETILKLAEQEDRGNRLAQFCGSFLIVAGVIMALLGLTGSVNWLVAAGGISSKLTNGSPGIVGIVAGVLLLFAFRRNIKVKGTRSGQGVRKSQKQA